MIKNLLILFLSAGSHLLSAANYEYDITKVGETINEEYYIGNPVKLHNNGYLTGTVTRTVPGLSNEVTDRERPYVYELATKKLKVINSFPAEGDMVIDYINHNGLATGRIFSNGYSFSLRGTFIYDIKTDNYLDLRELPEIKLREGNEWQPLAITDDNRVLVSSDNLGLGFTYDFKSKTIDFLPFYRPKVANSKGQWAGGGWSNPDQRCLPGWIYDPEKGYQEVDFLGSHHSFELFHLSQISQNGLIVGIAQQQKNYNFMWSENSGLIDLFVLCGFDPIKANNLGQVIGTQKFKDSSTKYKRAYYFDQKSGLIDLGTLGGLNSSAYDINDNGVVVGKSEIKKGKRDKKLFIWDKKKGMRNLESLIDLPKGWELTYVFSIDNQGHITGQGKYLGKKYNFLLVPKSKQKNK